MPCLSMETTSGLSPSNLPLPSQTINPKPRQTESSSGFPTTAQLHFKMCTLWTRSEPWSSYFIHLLIYLCQLHRWFHNWGAIRLPWIFHLHCMYCMWSKGKIHFEHKSCILHININIYIFCIKVWIYLNLMLEKSMKHPLPCYEKCTV